MRLIPVLTTLTLLAWAADQGVPPRASASDYEAHQSTTSATLAASIIPARQIEKLFSAEIARQYVVLEVAVYPQNGQKFDVDWFDFGLKTGDTVAHVDKPRDVAASIWPESKRPSDNPVTVTSETGVVYSRSNEPVYGRRTEWGTYEGVGVTNDPRAAPPPSMPRPDVDPRIIEQRVDQKMLPEGQTSTAVAGYLFFPRYKQKHRRGETVELQWSKNSASAVLRLTQN